MPCRFLSGARGLWTVWGGTRQVVMSALEGGVKYGF